MNAALEKTKPKPSPSPTPTQKVLDREFLEVRHTILTLAAALDRLQRAGECVPDDPRWQRLQAGLHLLVTDQEGRAEQVQLAFSRTYESDWREKFGL